MNTQLFQSLAISLLLGGLVGLQRQHVDSPLGGVRTFALVTVFGSLCAILAEPFGGWLVAAGLLATSRSDSRSMSPNNPDSLLKTTAKIVEMEQSLDRSRVAKKGR